MAYSTIDDLRSAFETDYVDQLSDDPTGQTADATIVSDCIARADGRIDSYLGVRYVVPLTTVSEEIRSMSAIIAMYFLFLRRSWTMQDNVKQAYDSCVEHLKDISNGEAVAVGATRSSSATAYFNADTQDYAHDTMTGF